MLFGRAIELQAFALLAVERMAARGLGSGRARFAVAAVYCPGLRPGEWCEVFSAEHGLSPGEPPAATLPAAGSPEVSACGTLRFLTPVRLKVRQQLAHTITFRSLAFAMLRRVLEVAHFHVPGATVDWTIRPLLERADAVRISAGDLCWHDWERYSARQGARMTLGGLKGSLRIEGEIAPFQALLSMAEVLHVGKGTTFGLGRLEWQPD